MNIFNELNDSEEVIIPTDLEAKIRAHATRRARKQRVIAAMISSALVLAFSSVAFAVAGGDKTQNINSTTNTPLVEDTTSTSTPITVIDPTTTVSTTPDTVGGTSVTTTPVSQKVYGKTYVDQNGDGLIDGRDGCDRNKDGVITSADNFDDGIPGKSEFHRNDGKGHRGNGDGFENNEPDDDDDDDRRGDRGGRRGGGGGRHGGGHR